MEIYGVNSVFSLNNRKYGSEKTPYLNTFIALGDVYLSHIKGSLPLLLTKYKVNINRR